jgi:tRNA pseudouridine38-40 synthase
VVIGSGRTDTGVHATGQTASVDMPAKWDAPSLERSLNAVLPDDIWVESVTSVPDDFHPRYDAVARTYEYQVGTKPEARSPMHRRWCWPLGEALPLEPLNRASEILLGEHWFRAFAKSGQPERGYRCTVARAGWSEWALGVRFRITADRYLHHMVRYLVGTMVDMAKGRRAVEDMENLLSETPSGETSPPAPPQGLFLARVEYPVSAVTAVHPETSDARRMTSR